MNDKAPLTGKCLCGAVRFEVTPPTKWCAHCHCSLCRRAHGAAFVTWFGVDRSGFELVAGDAELSWYQSTPEARRGFCSKCGSTIFFESERWGDEVHITANAEALRQFVRQHQKALFKEVKFLPRLQLPPMPASA